MASKWFEGLSEQSQGFLIAALLFRSRDRETYFSFLSEEDATVLRERARTVMELERTDRVRLLITELKCLLLRSVQPWLSAVDSSWIVQILKKEERSMQRLALAALPKSLSKGIGLSLEFSSRELERLQNLPPPLSKAIYQAIANQFTPMRAISIETILSVNQLLVLTKSEFEILIMELGKKQNSGESAFKLDDAQIQSEGLRTIAKLIGDEPVNLQNEIAQRLDYQMGQILLGYLEHARSDETKIDASVLKREVFSLLIQLAKDRMIDERFAECHLPQ